MYEEKLRQVETPVGKCVSLIEEIKEMMLRDFSAEEQKEILMGIKSKLLNHYSQLREEHLKEAEVLGNSFDALNF